MKLLFVISFWPSKVVSLIYVVVVFFLWVHSNTFMISSSNHNLYLMTFSTRKEGVKLLRTLSGHAGEVTQVRWRSHRVMGQYPYKNPPPTSSFWCERCTKSFHHGTMIWISNVPLCGHDAHFTSKWHVYFSFKCGRVVTVDEGKSFGGGRNNFVLHCYNCLGVCIKLIIWQRWSSGCFTICCLPLQSWMVLWT